jgi:hypothetical protein
MTSAAENSNNATVKDALKITKTLLKHLSSDCPHCKELFGEAFD